MPAIILTLVVFLSVSIFQAKPNETVVKSPKQVTYAQKESIILLKDKETNTFQKSIA